MNLKSLKLPSFSYGPRIRSTRDWLAILSASAVLFIASIAYNAWVFYDTARTDASPAAMEGNEGLTALPEARAVLEAREAEAERYRSFYEFVDPS